MNELSERLARALDFLKRNGYAKSDIEIAKKVGCTAPSLNMAKMGVRTPTWDLLLNLCDHYPINFWWLRSGEGSMIKDGHELALLQKIEQLENRIRELEEKK